ncbi:MAG: B12-binding domain-containing radical SAM protein [Planctomycetes bacterium]|nr:B12-binding domain-containing radical SAM protein [Planctomycetota bacterium]
MRIALVAMSGVRVRTAELAALGVTLPGFVRRGKVIASLPSLGLLTVAGLTPRRHELEYFEVDELEDGSEIAGFDLAGISSFTARIDDAYALADRLRAGGTRVALGGLHVSRLPGEALEHADAVVVNGAEGAWPRLLEDLESGRLQRLYEGAADRVFESGLYATPRFELLQGRAYNRFTVQTSRGCPRACELCAASLRITSRFNQKPVEKVIAEVREARRWFAEPFLELADDNSFIDRRWSRDFLRAMAREGVRWFTETDASLAGDPELCDLLAASGCKQVLIGFESPRQRDLQGMDPAGWKRLQAPRILRAVDALQSRGVSVNGCFVLGLDGQTPDVFPELLDFVQRSGLAEVQYTVLTPFPGTPLHDRLRADGRLLHEGCWDRCTLFDVNFVPRGMTVEDLEAGLRWLFQETYTLGATWRRLRSFAERQREAAAAAADIRAPLQAG